MSEFRVIDRQAPAKAADPQVRRVAEQVMRSAQSRTPRATGRLANSWRVVKDRDGRYLIQNIAPYAGYVEYGTSRMPARAMLGQALQSARHR
jgi:hypothetical protein